MSRKIPKLSCKEFAYAVFGMLLGDGSLAENKKGERVYLSIDHGPKQYGYASHKAEFLRQRCEYVNFRYVDTKQVFGDYRIARISAKPKRNVLRHLNKFSRLYSVNRKKIAGKYIMRRITPIGLMYWFMDDGTASVLKNSKGFLNRTFRLNTQGFDFFSKERISKCLYDRFGIHTHIIKAGNYTVHNLGVKGMRQLIDVIRPHLGMVPRCMRYKFDMKYPKDSKHAKYSTWSLRGQVPSERRAAA